MSVHYVCKGDNCSTVKNDSGMCESDFCNAKGEDLMICGCEDGKHDKKEEASKDTVEA